MSKSVILITGGTGFAGSHLVELLVTSEQNEVHVTSFSDRPDFVNSLLPNDQIHQLDLTDKNATQRLVEQLQPEFVYHLASFSQVGSSFDQAEKILSNNIQLQLNLLEAVRSLASKPRVLITGSAQEYDLSRGRELRAIDENWPLGPNNPYGVSKVTQDLLALSYHYSYDLDLIRVRPFNHIGERQTLGFVIADFAHKIAQIEKGTTAILQVGNLEAIRDFTDVKDMVAAYVLLMKEAQSGQVFNVGSGRGYKIQEILDKLIELSTATISVEVDSAKYRPLDTPQIIANNEKIKKLGWQPKISLDETLARILNYWRSQV